MVTLARLERLASRQGQRHALSRFVVVDRFDFPTAGSVGRLENADVAQVAHSPLIGRGLLTFLRRIFVGEGLKEKKS